jgi:hypothetical protein
MKYEYGSGVPVGMVIPNVLTEKRIPMKFVRVDIPNSHILSTDMVVCSATSCPPLDSVLSLGYNPAFYSCYNGLSLFLKKETDVFIPLLENEDSARYSLTDIKTIAKNIVSFGYPKPLRKQLSVWRLFTDIDHPENKLVFPVAASSLGYGYCEGYVKMLIDEGAIVLPPWLKSKTSTLSSYSTPLPLP